MRLGHCYAIGDIISKLPEPLTRSDAAPSGLGGGLFAAVAAEGTSCLGEIALVVLHPAHRHREQLVAQSDSVTMGTEEPAAFAAFALVPWTLSTIDIDAAATSAIRIDVAQLGQRRLVERGICDVEGDCQISTSASRP